MTTTPELARPPYTYTDGQNHRLALMITADFENRPYVWVEAEDLAIGGDITSMWLTIEQAVLLGDAIDTRTSGSFTDHTGDFLTIEPGDPHTVITVTRVRDEDDDPAKVRVVVLTGRLPEVRAALKATAERAQQRVTVQPEPEQTAEPTVTVTVAQVEAALRGYLAILDYDLHKNLECGEETGADTYAEEADDLFGRLRDAAGGGQ